MPTIHEVATITAKGQITLPRTVRKALGVEGGSKVAFEFQEDGQIVVSHADDEHQDPVIGAFLTLLADDIRAARHVRSIPDDLAREMLIHAENDSELDEDFDEEVNL